MAEALQNDYRVAIIVTDAFLKRPQPEKLHENLCSLTRSCFAVSNDPFPVAFFMPYFWAHPRDIQI